MKSYVKLYGPSLSKGLKKLEELISNKEEMSGKEILTPSQTERHGLEPTLIKGLGIIPKQSKTTVGEYDFVIEWLKDPMVEDIKTLIKTIDNALKGTGCSYMITTR